VEEIEVQSSEAKSRAGLNAPDRNPKEPEI
jgi:hypothetical protein